MIEYKIGRIAKKRGLTARKLADLAGIGHNTAALLVKARDNQSYNVCADVLDRICAALRAQPGELMKYRKG